MSRRALIFDDLQIFALVAEKLSYTETANELGVTTAAVSYAISRLEKRIVVKLFNRTTRSVKITEAGIVLRDHLVEANAQILAGIERAQAIETRANIPSD